MQDGTVNLSISKEIVNPIVDAKIKEAIIGALGGSEQIIKKVVDEIINQKVDANGIKSSYSSENKYTWLDAMVTKQIKDVVTNELKQQISNSSSEIKDALIEQIKTKRGSSLVATALLAGLEGTFKSSWSSKIDISLIAKGE